MNGLGRSPIACSTISLFSKPLDDAFPMIAEAGFDGIELMVTSDPDSQDADRVLGLSEDHALPVVAVHAPFLLMSRKVWGRDPVGKIERAVALALAVGAPLVVVHPPYRWQSSYRRWLNDRSWTVDERGVRIAVENMFPLRVRGRRIARFHAHHSVEDLLRFPEVVLDTSHVAVAGLDPVEAATMLGERLAHVHLSNNAGKGWDSHLPLDEGVLDLGRFLRALRDGGFGGAISLELDLRSHLEDRVVLRRTLSRNRELCEELLSLKT